MMDFIENNLVLRKKTGTHIWIVEKDFQFLFDNEWYFVHKDFESNLASVPRPLWFFFPQSGIYTEAPVIHDYLLTIMSRKDADRAFKEALVLCGTGPIRTSLMYAGVRLWSYMRYVQKKIKSIG